MPSVSPMMRKLSYSNWTCIVPSNILLVFCQRKFWLACLIAFPCGLIGAGVKIAKIEMVDKFVQDQAVYKTLNFFVVFLAAFRIDAAYHKFWSGCDLVYSIIGDIFDGVSDLSCFTRGSAAGAEAVKEFHQILVRLASLMNCMIFADLELGARASEHSEESSRGAAYNFELLDVGGLEDEAMEKLLKSTNKVEVVYLWLEMLVVDAQQKGIFAVPPPISARGLEELGKAVVHFHECQKISEIPFPFPYMVALQLLLVCHWMATPLVVAAWVDSPLWVFMFCFGGTFSLWFFVGIAVDLDQPFQDTNNSVDMAYLQQMLNRRLITIYEAHRRQSPTLAENTKQNITRQSMVVDGDVGISMGKVISRRRSLRMSQTGAGNSAAGDGATENVLLYSC